MQIMEVTKPPPSTHTQPGSSESPQNEDWINFISGLITESGSETVTLINGNLDQLVSFGDRTDTTNKQKAEKGTIGDSF